MQLIPIFDTSVIRNLSDLSDSDPLLRQVKSRIPKHGCPLSSVMLIELILGLCRSDSQQIDASLKPILLAARLSRRGNVLSYPITFVRKELFQADNWRHDRVSTNLMRDLTVMEQPDFANRFVSGEVKEIDCGRFEMMFAKIQKEFHGPLRQFLERRNPNWETDRKRLTEQQCEEIKVAQSIWKLEAPGRFLDQLKIERTARNLEKASHGCDAYFETQSSILWESASSNYNFDRKASNDFHDWVQLLYLAHPSYCMVTADTKWKLRASKSSQSNRILTIDEFLSAA